MTRISIVVVGSTLDVGPFGGALDFLFVLMLSLAFFVLVLLLEARKETLGKAFELFLQVEVLLEEGDFLGDKRRDILFRWFLHKGEVLFCTIQRDWPGLFSWRWLRRRAFRFHYHVSSWSRLILYPFFESNYLFNHPLIPNFHLFLHSFA